MSQAKRSEDFTVVANTDLTPRHFLLELTTGQPLPDLLPGQFVQVLIDNAREVFLRRPFSIHQVDRHKHSIRLLVQIKGEGTRTMHELRPGDRVNLLYPLGNSFHAPAGGNVLLVGGGCGVAPLLFLAEFLGEKGISPHILIGGRFSRDLFELNLYRRLGKVFITTEDGSEGEKGLVTGHSILRQNTLTYSAIYACGPEAMMQSVAGIAGKHGIPCQVSLENTMACGFGVCLCCVTSTKTGNQRVCVEGPVFDTKVLNW